MTATRNDVVRCPWCQRLTLPIQVHGHVQCQHCGINIDPCCGGEQAQAAPAPTVAQPMTTPAEPSARPARRVRISMDAARAVRRQSSIMSPCTAVCTIIPGTELCAGCYRSVDEIRDWLYYDDPAKRQVIQRLDARRLEWQGQAEARLARLKRPGGA
jgi:predicted Fe-S protein YdhL (DUF1289 family)